jgi:hypothetical protein
MPAQPMTHVEMLNLERVPEHLVVVGGGFVGLEFAQAMRRFGSRVTIVQHGKQLLTDEDTDVAEGLLQLMKDDGIEVLLESTIESVTGRSGSGVQLQVRTAEIRPIHQRLRHSRGRRPNAEHRSSPRRKRQCSPGFKWLCSGQRATSNQRRGRLGHGRMRRQSEIHARGPRRLHDRSG